MQVSGFWRHPSLPYKYTTLSAEVNHAGKFQLGKTNRTRDVAAQP